MKTSYILALVVILAVLVIAWISVRPEPGTNTTPAPTVQTTDTTPPQSETSSSGEDMGMTAEEHARMMDMDMNMDMGLEPPANVAASGELSVDPNAKVFNISGKNFAFDVKEIRVKEGDTVVINFTSADGFHDWTIAEFEARTSRVNTGGSSSVTFVADKKGAFEYYCSVGQHRQNGMVGTLIVE